MLHTLPSCLPANAPRRTPFGLAVGLAALLTGAPALAGPPAPYGQMIVFGDSISDSGTYAARAPGAGSFTTNPDPVWVEVIADQLGLDLTPHIDGGTNFAEGGARVAAWRPNAPGDLSRRPVTAQVDDFLAGSGPLSANSLIIIQGGGNDVFHTQTNGLSFTPADLAVLDEAATSLAGQVRRLEAAGAGVIVTTSVPQFEVFNERYRAALRANPSNVLYVDIARLIDEIEASPATYGIRNITDPACKGAAVQSFTCLPATYVAPDANRTYLFADGVHFTGVVHEMEAQATLAALLAPTQISQIPYVLRAEADAQQLGLRADMGPPTAGDAESWRVFGAIGGGQFETEGGPQHLGLESQAERGAVGLRLQPSADLVVGALAGWSNLEGDFSGDAGRLEADVLSLAVFGAARLGRFDLRADLGYAYFDLESIERDIRLGPAIRTERGETDGHRWTLGAEVGRSLPAGPLVVRPAVGLRYDQVQLSGYTEAGDRSTQMTFGGQKLETLQATAGLEAAWADRSAAVRPYGRIAYAVDLLGDDRTVRVAAQGAPVTFMADAYTIDEAEFRYEVGFETSLGARGRLVGGLAGVAGADTVEGLTGFVGLSLRY